jgi:stage II sporulation protein AA (anti-sigma F factor antagonist)
MIKTNHTFCAEFYDGTLRVTLEGEIDHHSAVATRGEIDRLIYEYRPRRLELALSRIGFMDSSGLGLVMGRYSLIRELGGELAVIDPSPAIMRIFKLAGMDRLIRIEYTDKPQASEETEKEKARDE